MADKTPSFGEMVGELVEALAAAKSPDEKVVVLRYFDDVFSLCGVRVYVDVPEGDSEPQAHIVIPDQHPEVAKLFAGSPWANGGWAEAMSSAPGASSGLLDMADPSSRATFVPVSLFTNEFGVGAARH